MRGAAFICVVLAACSGDSGTDATDADDGTDGAVEPASFDFGPYTLTAGEERTDDCVQISMHNETAMYVNAVELTTGPGFHHSNWLFVPDSNFAGPDGTFPCDDRGYSEQAAATVGGVIFAQSTQSTHEIQQFPAGTVVRVPAHSKLMSSIHLLNATDGELTITPSIKLTPIAQADVVTRLAGLSFMNQALALPVNRASRFTVDCELADAHQTLTGRPLDFKIYYALAHYHALGVGLNLEAIDANGVATSVYTTETAIGDSLGGMIEPAFDMTGFKSLRLTCDYINNTDSVVRWGNGDQEMCEFLAFTDSELNWGGGVLSREAPQNPVDTEDRISYTNPCQVVAVPAER